MTKLRKRILGLGCAALFALSGVSLPMLAPVRASADASVLLVAGEGAECPEKTELSDGKLSALPTPVREGYDFVGWFTKPVETVYWGDDDDETWQKLKETYGTDYTYLNGKPISWYNTEETPEDPEIARPQGQDASQGQYDWINSRWIENSVGVKNVTKGEWVHAGDEVPAGSSLYAMYDPKNITVKWYNNGWDGVDDTWAVSTGRSSGFEYGGKFAYLPLDVWEPWQGHEFKGWVDAKGNKFEFALSTLNQDLKEFYAPANYEPELRLYATYDDVTAPLGSPEGAEFVRVDGNGGYFDPDASTHTFVIAFDSRYKVLPEIEWQLTGGEAFFDLTVSADKTKATLSVKEALRGKLTENTRADIRLTVGEHTYDLSATASHNWNNGRILNSWRVPCTTPLDVLYTCKTCGQTKTKQFEPDGHRYVSYDTPATCTADGYTVRVCVVCGEETRIDHAGSALGHSWNVSTVRSCNGSVTTTVCTRCGESHSEEDSTPCHEWESGYTVDVAPTCTTAGSRSIHCKNCAAVKDSEPVPATGHRYTETKHEATCTESGYTVRTCALCGDSETVITEEPKGHTPAAPVTERAPSCNHDGVRNTYCADCGILLGSETLPASGDLHSWTAWTTETRDGFEIVSRDCTVCGAHEETRTPLPEEPAEPETSVEPEVPAEPALPEENKPAVEEELPAPEEIPEVTPEEIPEEVPEVTPEVVPEVTPEVVPEKTPEEKPELPAVAPEKLPEKAPSAPALPDGMFRAETQPGAAAPKEEPASPAPAIPSPAEENNALIGGTVQTLAPAANDDVPANGAWIVILAVCGAAVVCASAAVVAVAVKRRK